MYIAAGVHALEIATHRHGCCALQRRTDVATFYQHEHLWTTMHGMHCPSRSHCSFCTPDAGLVALILA